MLEWQIFGWTFIAMLVIAGVIELFDRKVR